MICNTEEFLLVLQKWITDSATVSLRVLVFDDPKDAALGMYLRGRVASVDKGLPGFRFVFGEDDFIIFNLSVWSQIGYGENVVLPDGEQVGQSFTIARPGASVAIWTTIDS
jgi:hypothetical protein